MTALNPIEVELLRNGLTSICDEMYVALMKSAYSTNIKERRDHSTAIMDPAGRLIIQAEAWENMPPFSFVGGLSVSCFCAA